MEDSGLAWMNEENHDNTWISDYEAGVQITRHTVMNEFNNFL